MKGYLATKKGIVAIPEERKIRAIFCRHRNTIEGEMCSEIGMRRISGEDRYLICMNCGRVLAERHTTY